MPSKQNKNIPNEIWKSDKKNDIADITKKHKMNLKSQVCAFVLNSLAVDFIPIISSVLLPVLIYNFSLSNSAGVWFLSGRYSSHLTVFRT